MQTGQGFRKESSTHETTKKWDFELVSNLMKHMRGWSGDRCRSEWESFKADQSLEKDNGGYKGAERIELPANLLGEVGSTEQHTAFEENKLETRTKGKKFTEAEEE